MPLRRLFRPVEGCLTVEQTKRLYLGNLRLGSYLTGVGFIDSVIYLLLSFEIYECQVFSIL